MFSSQFSSAARIPQRLNSPAARQQNKGRFEKKNKHRLCLLIHWSEITGVNISGFEFTSLSSLRLLVDTVCPQTDVFPCSCRGTTRNRCWLCSSSQHIAPSGHRSLASVDGKGQVWLADASLHTSTDFGSPPPQAPVNQELMKGYLRHMRHLARVSTRTSLFIPLLWKFIFLFSLCCQFMSLKGGLRRRIIRLLKPLCIREVISPVCCSQWGLSDENHYVSEP